MVSKKKFGLVALVLVNNEVRISKLNFQNIVRVNKVSDRFNNRVRGSNRVRVKNQLSPSHRVII